MAVTHDEVAAAAATNAVVDLLDVGTGRATGALVYKTAGGVEVATCLLSNPAFGAGTSAAPSVATAGTIADDTSATGGTIAKAQLEDRDSAARIFCSVTAPGGGGDIEITSVTVAALETVATSSLTYAGPS